MTDQADTKAGAASPAQLRGIVDILTAEAEDSRALLATLQHLLDDEDADSTMKRDALEGQTNVYELIDKALVEEEMLTAHIAGMVEVIRSMTARRDRLKERRDLIRTALAVTMESIGEDKLARAPGTITLKKAAHNVEVDPDREYLIPDKYWFTPDPAPPPEPKLITKTLIADLEAGEEIVGCRLVDSPRTIAIRRK